MKQFGKLPKIINGNIHIDDRGLVEFNNNINFKEIKRFYIVSNFKNNFVRAWHAHKKESKLFYCLQGCFQVSLVKVDKFDKPKKNLKCYNFFLKANVGNFLYVPPGYANGLKNLKTNSKLLTLSNKNLKESLNDDFRYDAYYWNPWTIKER